MFELFDEYAVRYARGEFPDPGDYLGRAGAEAEQLASMLDLFLQWAPPPEPSEVAVELMQAWIAGEPPLRVLRVRRSLRVDDVVQGLAAALAVDVAHVGKLRRYCQQLERGSLEVARVDSRVFDALASLLTAPASLLRAYAALPRGQLSATAAPAYRADEMPALPPRVRGSVDEEWDEVDELFVGEQHT